jgi:putative DNA primase/helicase
MAQTMLDAALAYAARGWPVFPCSPVTKAPLTPKETIKGAKDGGLYLATTDEAQIRGWWKRWPKAMIGVRTGAATGGFVVDLDPDNSGAAADDMRAALADWCGGMKPSAVARTRSGGLHLWFALPADVVIGNRGDLFKSTKDVPDAPECLRGGVDVRADGGYVIVPPSVMETGQFYAWEVEPLAVMQPPPQRLTDVIARAGEFEWKQPEPSAKPAQSISQRAMAGSASAEPQEAARRKYAAKALEKAAGEVRNAGKGGRNNNLQRAAFLMGGMVAAGYLSETLARSELLAAAQANGLAAEDGEAKILDQINRAMEGGAAKPIDFSNVGLKVGTGKKRGAAALRPAPPDEVPPADDDGASPDPSKHLDGPQPSQSGGSRESGSYGGEGGEDLSLAFLPLTDLGNAQRFVRRFGADFLHVPEWGWLAFDGKRWNKAEAESLLAFAVHNTVKMIADEADAFIGTKYDTIVKRKPNGDVVMRSDQIRGWGLSSQGNAHISCIAKLAMPYLSAKVADFDSDPMAINVENGTLRAAKRDDGDYITFEPHRREDKITKLSPVVFDPNAQCPMYDSFILWAQPEVKMQRLLHAWGGLSFTGVKMQMISLWWGGGSNGKSTAIDAWHHVYGDYGGTVPIETFLEDGRQRSSGQATPDLATLPGLRSVRTSEPRRGAVLDEALIKQLTGGEKIKARHLMKDYFEFEPVFKLTVSFNPKPVIKGAEHATWRRIMLVPWESTVEKADMDPDLPNKLRREASGILNRLLDGLRDWLDHGLIMPESVIDATAQYRDESDPLRLFIDAAIAQEPGSRVNSTDLYNVYLAWARWAGQPEYKQAGFSRALSERGFVKKQSNTVQWLDIKLIKWPADFPAPDAGDDARSYPPGYGHE